MPQHLEATPHSSLYASINRTEQPWLFEAIFLTLCSTPAQALMLRQNRGLDGNFAGTARQIENAMWSGLFFEGDMRRTISVRLSGDGPENRSLTMSRGHGETVIPFGLESDRLNPSAIMFEWRDAGGVIHSYAPKITTNNITMPASEEDLPDFFFFSANQTISSLENASRFSEMSKSGETIEFVNLFRKEYPWISDLSIEVLGGIPVVHATVENSSRKIPLNDVSGGINRLFGILLAIASRPKSVVIVDEIENGIFHGHFVPFWRALMDFAIRYDSQLFLSTHSQEWLDAMLEVSKTQLGSMQYWRIERQEHQPVIRRFSGEELSLAARAGSEVR